MSKRFKIACLLVIILSMISFNDCGAILDCLLDEHIQFDTSSLPEGTVNQNYQAEIQASVKNSWADDSYDYHFEIVQGRLPNDLFMEQSGRIATIKGIPVEEGSFIINVRVYSNELMFEEADQPLDNCITWEAFREFDLTILP